MYIWGRGQTICRQSRVGSGRVNVSPGRVGPKKSDPWTTLVINIKCIKIPTWTKNAPLSLASSSSSSRVHTGDIDPQWRKTDCCMIWVLSLFLKSWYSLWRSRMSEGTKFHSCGAETEKPLRPDRSFRYRGTMEELSLRRWPKVAPWPCWDVIHGMAELDQVLRCTAIQAVARYGV